MCIKTKAKAKHKVTLKPKQQHKITVQKGYANIGGDLDTRKLPNINELIIHYNIGALEWQDKNLIKQSQNLLNLWG